MYVFRHEVVNVVFGNFEFRRYTEELLFDYLLSFWYYIKATITYFMNREVSFLVRSIYTLKNCRKRKFSKEKIDTFMLTNAEITNTSTRLYGVLHSSA